MLMDAYQRSARKTVIYPREHMVVYPALGLAGEAGEVCEKIKKVMRDSTHKSDFWDKRDDIEMELGDVLWYIANLATDLGLSMDIIAAKNLEKLRDRQDRDALQGEGDDR
jgi:NTP pyrophosphatase (non-canonical NTP hydrolase)